MSGERHLRNIDLLKKNLKQNQCPNCKKQYDNASAFCKHKRSCKKKDENEATRTEGCVFDNEADAVTKTPPTSQQTKTHPPEWSDMAPGIMLELLKQNRELHAIVIERYRNSQYAEFPYSMP
jgi:hypothetical protein